MAKAKHSGKTSDALEILWQEHYRGNPDRIVALQQEILNAAIAHAVHRLRKQADLTQKELADLIGTKASSISRLENAEYGVRSLTMLTKIAAAFEGRLSMSIVPISSRSRVLRAPSGKSLGAEQILS